MKSINQVIDEPTNQVDTVDQSIMDGSAVTK